MLRCGEGGQKLNKLVLLFVRGGEVGYLHVPDKAALENFTKASVLHAIGCKSNSWYTDLNI
jgi:hypothetical protein